MATHIKNNDTLPPTYISVDVEAAATGYGHSDREPCWIAVVDVHGTELLNIVVDVPQLVSPMTSITGLTTETFSQMFQYVWPSPGGPPGSGASTLGTAARRLPAAAATAEKSLKKWKGGRLH